MRGKPRRKLKKEALMLLPLYLFTLIFIVGPLVYMVVLSFLQRAETWGVTSEFTLKNYQNILEPEMCIRDRFSRTTPRRIGSKSSFFLSASRPATSSAI